MLEGKCGTENAVEKQTEQVLGIRSGELFVRLNGLKLCESHGTLHGVRPFLLQLLHLLDDETTAQQRLVQPSQAKVVWSRTLRRQIRQRRVAAKERYDAARDVIQVYSEGTIGTKARHLFSADHLALERYLRRFQSLEEVYKQHVIRNILHFSTLLEAEKKYITTWSKREQAKVEDQCELTKLRYRFSTFALQLERETSGQVRVWRLLDSDPQRLRCTKAAIENVKKGFFLSSRQSLEVLDVYKIDNRVLLNNYQRYTHSSAADIKIKGLFCYVPADSVERCIVYGMHAPIHGEPCFIDSQGVPIEVFSRSALLLAREEALFETNLMSRARLKVMRGTPLQFPRRFSRFSTFEEMRPATKKTNLQRKDQLSVQYLGLCRVAMSKVQRAKSNGDTSFPEDPRIEALHFTNEGEYLVRYPDAVVPEFIIQLRITTLSSPRSIDVLGDRICSTDASSTFQELVCSASFESFSSATSAFPLLATKLNKRSFSATTELPADSYQDEDALAKKAAAHARVPLKIVLGDFARKKTQLRQDLQRLEKFFWSKVREEHSSFFSESENQAAP